VKWTGTAPIVRRPVCLPDPTPGTNNATGTGMPRADHRRRREYQASAKLAQAADAMAADPAALQLRLLQAIVEIAFERSRTVIVPVPVELLRYFERAVRTTSPAQLLARPAAHDSP